MKHGVSDTFREMAEFYAKFAVGCEMDFSEQALVEAFEAETFGIKHDLRNNGFAFGKKSMNITIAAWREDIQDGLMCKHDILRDYDEESFAHSVVASALDNCISGEFFAWRNLVK